ncbi:SAM-dependent methyltransferase [Microbacterium sp.]|uniref:SAM-dependent methyltransferase n=1 Tax=Microbacterium sp. TaxID=51671 RepID=UPI0032220F37
MWPFLYFADDRLSTPELMAARLDGHLIEVGEGFMPADAVETRELRAASLRRVCAPGLAFTHESAAWVHGALTEVPRRHCVQRTGARRRPPLLDRRLRYRDGRLADRDVVIVSGVAVTVPERTLADLVRDRVDSDGAAPTAADALIAVHPGLVRSTLAWLEGAPPLRRKRHAVACLRDRLERDGPGQDDVTR